MRAAPTITTTATMTTILTDDFHHEGTQARSNQPFVPSCLGGEKAALNAPPADQDLTPSPPALLRLLAWLSPAFPTGAFAYSHGLEWAVESGDITNETTLRDWLTEVVTNGTGRTDTILLRQAHRATADLASLTEIADLAAATASCRERQSESLDQGRAFMLAATPWGIPDAPERIPYPVAVGAVAGAHRIPEDATAVAFLQAFITNLISAAVRLVPLGQTAGLRVLAALEPTILSIATETKAATLDDLGGCAFRSDLAAMRHETQYTRLFRS
jgi:urease accessory protein